MEAFSAEWLALREPADHVARATRLVTLVVNALASYSPPAVTVVDFGAGTGSNLRYLSRRLPFGQRWTLVDHDQRLLNKATRDWELAGDAVPHGVTVRARRVDLARLDESAFTGAAAGAPQAPLLVTASALLDLTSVDWLDRLAARCRALRALTLFALTYDGRITCEPPDPADEMVRALVNRHQQTDKGFGPAAGPDAVQAATDAFEREGYSRVPRAERLAAGSRVANAAAAARERLGPGRRGAVAGRCRRHRRVARAPPRSHRQRHVAHRRRPRGRGVYMTLGSRLWALGFGSTGDWRLETGDCTP